MKGNNTSKIGGELESIATGGVVVSADGVYDYTKGKSQEQVNDEVITNEENLFNLYTALTRADIQIVTSLPTVTSATEDNFRNKVYRLAGQNNYSDYMLKNDISDYSNAFQLMATYTGDLSVITDLQTRMDIAEDNINSIALAEIMKPTTYETAANNAYPGDATRYICNTNGSNSAYRGKTVKGIKVRAYNTGTLSIVKCSNITVGGTTQQTSTVIKSVAVTAGEVTIMFDNAEVFSAETDYIGIVGNSSSAGQIYYSSATSGGYGFIYWDSTGAKYQKSNGTLSAYLIVESELNEKVSSFETWKNSVTDDIDKIPTIEESLEGKASQEEFETLQESVKETLDPLNEKTVLEASAWKTQPDVTQQSKNVYRLPYANISGQRTNSPYKGKKILGVKVRTFGNNGTLTVAHFTNITNGGTSFEYTEIQTFTGLPSGDNVLYFTTPYEGLNGDNDYIGFTCSVAMRGKTYSSTQEVGFFYWNTSTSKVVYTNSVLYAAVIVENKIDDRVSAIEELAGNIPDVSALNARMTSAETDIVDLQSIAKTIDMPLLNKPLWHHWQPDSFIPIGYILNFTVSGITSVSVGAVYKNNATNVMCTVLSTNLTDGSGTITCECSGFGVPSLYSANMVLTLVSGSGDGSISYSGYNYKKGIPSQSVEDNLFAFRLGFNMVEVNIQKTSDNKFVVTHGQTINSVAGCFGNEFSEPYRSTKIDTMTQENIVANVNYNSAYSCYNHHCSTAEEFFNSCAMLNMGILLRTNATSALQLARKYFQDSKIIVSLTNLSFGNTVREAGFKGMLGWYIGSGTGSTVCDVDYVKDIVEAYGGAPFHIAYHGNLIQYMIDNGTLESFISTLKGQGIYIGAAYATAAQTARLIAAGGWGIASQLWQCNPFCDANVGSWSLTDIDLSDWTIPSGVTINGGTITNNSGSAVSIITPSTGKLSIGKGNIQARIVGDVTFYVGPNTIEFDDYTTADPMLDFAIAGTGIDMKLKVTIANGSSLNYLSYQVSRV